MIRRTVLVAGVFASAVAGPARAQCVTEASAGGSACPLDAPRWVGEFATLGVNAALGGLTAGLMQHFRGGSFTDGFTRGLLGGTVIYAGKRLAVERFAGAGLAGREVAAVGSSIVRNAAAGAGSLDVLVLPVWLGRLYIERKPGLRIVPRLDAQALAWAAYAVAEPELRFRIGESLSAGAPVFRTDDRILVLDGDSTYAAGVTNAGVMLVADVPAYGAAFSRRALAHERVHVIQEDQLFLTLTDPAEDWLAGRIPLLRDLLVYLDANLSTQLLRAGGHVFPDYAERPWEMEAVFLAR